MAINARTAFVSSLIRCVGGRQSSCVKKIFEQNRIKYLSMCSATGNCGLLKERPTWSANNVRSLKVRVTWSLPLRTLTTDAPCKDDEYPPLPEYTPSQELNAKEVFIIHVKGLPWSCSPDDLMTFFSECQIRGGVKGIHLMTTRYGKPNGQAFIELEHEEDVSKALERHRQYLGPRYVEVYEVTNKDAEAMLKGAEENKGNDGVVLLRGLPFHCTEKEVIQFFSGLDIVKDGVTLVTGRRGRSSGEAYVQFATQEMADQALQRNRDFIGNRYIEVFPSKKSEILASSGSARVDSSVTSSRPNRTNSFSVTSHCVHMRGLPFQATAADIVNFFSPIRPVKVLMEFGPDGRTSGEAQAHFASHHDAVAAMDKDKEYIQDRYIELFLNSSAAKEEH
ncbi:G-rich sequence factor 1 [Brachyhypopomus gauderio]|uniref:G-rich sequence factor 1 n=1 Tax=Brachyhypopomus gauderio TaxID=698409 RepID=UPI0040434A73